MGEGQRSLYEMRNELRLVFHLLPLFQLGISTLTSNITGGEVCPEDVISFTCTHDPPEDLLQWTITESGQITPVASALFSFSSGQPPPYEITLPNVVNGRAILNSTSPSVVSTLTLTTTMQLDGATVLCRGTPSIDNAVITLASQLPSPPQNVMVTIVENGTTTVTVNIDWDPPVNNDGGAVDSYTVETSPETTTVRVTSGTTATLRELSYNERYVVSVTAVNCVGNSTPEMSNPVEFVNCSTPSTNPNNTFEPYQNTTEGSVISYQCRPGFIPEGRNMSVCGSDGRWNPDPGQRNCSEVNCGAPRLPVNGSVVSGPSNEYRKGSEVTFQCNEGLFPSIKINITCTSEESWSPNPEGILECREEPVTCSRPNAPRGGFLDEVTSTTLMFGCNDSPQETMTAVCVATDIWSPNPAQWECTATSTHPPPTTNTTDSSSNGRLGAVAGGVGGILVFILIVVIIVIIVVVVIMKKRSYTPKRESSLELQTSNPAGSLEGTLNGEYSKLQHPEGEGYSVLQHPGPHGNQSSGNEPGGLVYADVGNFDKSKKRVFEMSTASELDDNKVQYSALTHKPPPPPEVAAVDKLLNLDSLAIQLKEVTSIWYELGEQLGIPREMLNDIESHYNNVEDRRIEMFDVYLRMEPHPTWSQVAKALRRLHENTLAEKLENSYVTGQLPIQINMDVVPSTSYKYEKGPPPPLPPKSSDFDFDDSVDVSSPAPLILPPKPPKQGDSSSWKRPPPPVPQFDAEVVPPPRPPKSGEPAQPPLPPKPKNL